MSIQEIISRRTTLFGMSFLISFQVAAQQANLDSLKSELTLAENDTVRLVTYGRIASLYKEINPDSTYRYSERVMLVAQKMELRLEEARALGEMAYSLTNLSNYPRSLQTLLKAISIAEDSEIETGVLPPGVPAYDEFTDRNTSAQLQRLALLGKLKGYLAILYGNSGNFKKGLSYLGSAISLAKESGNLPTLSIAYSTLGRAYSALNNPDSAVFCLQKAYEYAMQSNYNRYTGSTLLNIGRVYMTKKDPQTAKQYFSMALTASKENDYFRGVVACRLELAELYKASGKIDSSRHQIRQGLTVSQYMNAPDLLLRCYTALVDHYKKTNTDSTVKYQSLIIEINKETFNAKQVQQFQNIDFDEQQRQNEMETAQKEFQAQLRTNIFLGSTFTLVVIAFFLYRNNRTKQKAKQNIEKAYDQLKSAQAQLVQSEKMASLGELTAGIAHEIQNPLNFVNNFSEVNAELIEELKAESEKPKADRDDQVFREILDTLKENELKVVQHGKRADAIVKGMLQHSRTSSGKKEPTDLNALCDEYLRLSYHGLRAKDKSFNAKFETHLDPSLPKINVVPQEIGRVVLNLINNAFYAVTEKKKQNPENYEPTVTVSTSLSPGEGRGEARVVEIRVTDNGPGIPSNIKDKIFQPFFTTKPTGQGTGLGLSLSYDIITKGHGGELMVVTKGEGSEFIIQLPVSLRSL